MPCNDKLYDQVTTIFTSALVLLSALAIRDAIVVYIDSHPSVKAHGPYAYAAFIVILSILTIYLIMFPLKKFSCDGK
jgi:hypothetical protein